MNKRIEELAIETFFDESTNGGDQKMYTFGEDKMQLFAQLIVQECADIVKNGYVPDVFSESCLEDIANDIQEHFGVKE